MTAEESVAKSGSQPSAIHALTQRIQLVARGVAKEAALALLVGVVDDRCKGVNFSLDVHASLIACGQGLADFGLNERKDFIAQFLHVRFKEVWRLVSHDEIFGVSVNADSLESVKVIWRPEKLTRGS